MKPIGMAAAVVFSVVLLLAALALGFMASWRSVDPNLHGMFAFLAGVLAVALHVRGGSGFDFLAVVLLVVALALGIMVSGGGMSPEIHFWAAVSAVGVSAGTQIRNLLSGDAIGVTLKS